MLQLLNPSDGWRINMQTVSEKVKNTPHWGFSLLSTWFKEWILTSQMYSLNPLVDNGFKVQKQACQPLYSVTGLFLSSNFRETHCRTSVWDFLFYYHACCDKCSLLFFWIMIFFLDLVLSGLSPADFQCVLLKYIFASTWNKQEVLLQLFPWIWMTSKLWKKTL